MSMLVPILALAAMIGCTQASPTAMETTAKPAPASDRSPAVEKDSWQAQWETVKAAARQESRLVLVSGAAAALREEGNRIMTQQFGVSLEFTMGLPSEIIPKVLAERRAGLYTVDIFLTSPPTALGTLKPAGILEPMDKTVFLPEALEPGAWYNGAFPWVDKEHYLAATLAIPKSPILVNTNLVKPDEIKSYRDLLNPKWKGRIAMHDPTKAGSGNAWFSTMAEGVMGLDFVREFVKQEPVISRDERLLIEWVAKEKYPILVGPKPEIGTEFQRAGALIQLITPVEGTYVGTSGAAVCLLTNAPHPNASRLFINWILTKEGGTFLARAYGGQSARVDVPTDFINPVQVRQPGGKYIDENNEEYARKQNEYQKVAEDMFRDLLK